MVMIYRVGEPIEGELELAKLYQSEEALVDFLKREGMWDE